MAYELFDNKAVRLGSPALTITTDGRVALNADAGDILRRFGAKFVHVLWDSEARKLALKPLTKGDERAYKLTGYGGQKRGLVFSAIAFLNYIGWDSSQRHVVSVEWNDKDKLLEASLPQGPFQSKGPQLRRRGSA